MSDASKDANKKVEVRYGSFTCSIEGYDNPVEQLREILGLMQNMISETPQLAEQAGDFDPTNVEDALSGGKEQTPGVVVIRNADAPDAPTTPAAETDKIPDEPVDQSASEIDHEDADDADILVVDRPSDAFDTIDPDLVADLDAQGDDTSDVSGAETTAAGAAPETSEDDSSLNVVAAEGDQDPSFGEVASFADYAADESAGENEPMFDVDAVEAETTSADAGTEFGGNDAVEVAAQGTAENRLEEVPTAEPDEISIPPQPEQPDHDKIDLTEAEDPSTDTQTGDETSGDSVGGIAAATATAAGSAIATGSNFSSWGDRIAGFVLGADESAKTDEDGITKPSAFGGAGALRPSGSTDDQTPQPTAADIDHFPTDQDSAATSSPTARDLEWPVDDNADAATEYSSGTSDNRSHDIEPTADTAAVFDTEASAADALVQQPAARLSDEGEDTAEDALSSADGDEIDIELDITRPASEDLSDDAQQDTPADRGGEVLNIFAAPTSSRRSTPPVAPVNIFAAAPARGSADPAEVTQPAAARDSGPVVNIFGAPAPIEPAPEAETIPVGDAMVNDPVLEDELTAPEEETYVGSSVDEAQESPISDSRYEASDDTSADADTRWSDVDENAPTSDAPAALSSDAPIPDIFKNMPDDIAAEFSSDGAKRGMSESPDGAGVEYSQSPVSGRDPFAPDSSDPGTSDVAPLAAEITDQGYPTASDAFDRAPAPEEMKPEIIEAEVVEAELVDPGSGRRDVSPRPEFVDALPPEDMTEAQPRRSSGFNIFSPPPADHSGGPLKRFADSFSSDEPSEPPIIDATPEPDPSDGPRPPWERPDGPMPDYSASARVRAGLDPFPKPPQPTPAPAVESEPGTAVSGDVLSDQASPTSASQSRFQALLQRVNSNFEDGQSVVPQTETSATEDLPDLSATDLATRAGGQATADLLAASAAWLTLYKGTPQFTRREVMQVFDTIPGEHPRTLEARIKGYGKLLRAGSIRLVDDGVFAMSEDAIASFEDIIRAG